MRTPMAVRSTDKDQCGTKRSLRKRAVAVTAASAAVALAVPAVASATYIYYFPYGDSGSGGAVLYGQSTGDRHSLFENSARSLDGRTVCIETYLENGSPIQNACSSTLAARKDLCGCNLKTPQVRVPSNGTPVTTRAQEVW